ncbi:choice-of-anchor D domain-containing protein [Paracidovorax konjaci]|uniref:choice-of-anchor D domain-containing protein n=1 Tax=Paracidovorax konjaci TaxID=32040 RepID=UPI0015877F80|nr:choice-of-anchor D domain-containing protein [Paracidovorax konjaci]
MATFPGSCSPSSGIGGRFLKRMLQGGLGAAVVAAVLSVPAPAFAKSSEVEPAAAPVAQEQRPPGRAAASRRLALRSAGALTAKAVPVSFSNPAAITITDCPNPCPASGQPASLFPSPITVSGVTGVVERVSVTLRGLSHGFPADIDILLVSPSGRKSVIMSDFGAGSPGISNIDVTLDDYADRPIPSTVTGNTGVPFVTGTYRPANSGTTDVFAAPAPAAPYTYTLSAFNGEDPNGTWRLYISDDANLDGGTLSGGWTLSFDSRPAAPAPGDILVSEFRTRGAGTAPPGSDGSADEFIELYNNTDQSITIIDATPGADPTAVGGAGWRLSAAQGGAETAAITISQTSSTAGPLAIAPRSYFLIATQPTTPSPAGNTYSLSTYPTGTGITASGSANFSINPADPTVGFLADDSGVAIFSTAAASSASRLDAVGYGAVTSTDHKEGAGLAPASGITTAGQHSWVRRSTGGFPQDTGDNAADFQLVDTQGRMLDGVAAVLGAPGPQRGHTMTAFTTTASPMHGLQTFTSAAIDAGVGATAAPNEVRDATPVTNGSEGTLKIRRRYTNNGSQPIIALRYRVVDLSTYTGGAPPAGQSDLRLLGSPVQTITLSDATQVTTAALAVQTPPAQAMGGGVNTSVADSAVTTTAPLAVGASRTVEFNLGVNTAGTLPYRFTVIAEALYAQGFGGATAVDTFTNVAPAALTVTPAAAPFGSVAVGGSGSPQTVTLGNSGGAPLQVTGLTAAAAPFSRTGGTCSATPITIAGGASCTLIYGFAPTATGPASQALAVSAGAAGSGTITLSGTGTAAAPAVLDTGGTATLDFGSVAPGGTATRTLTLSNTGGSALTVNTLSAATAPFSQGGGTCGAAPFTLAAGASCTLGYLYAPTASTGATQTVNIASSGGSATITLQASAAGATSVAAIPVGGAAPGLLLVLLLMGCGAAVLRRRG